MKKTAALMFLVGLAACGGGEPTGSACPTTSAPTYTDFGKNFFDTYCVRCHKSYASEAGIQREAADIDTQSAKGPNATNTNMPEGGAKPTDAEREKLGQYMACIK
jgi:cytochrome c5